MNSNYNLKDLIKADKRISQRWERNKIKLFFNKKDKVLIVGTLNYINKINNLGTKKIFAIDESKPSFLKIKRFKNVKFYKSNFKKLKFKKNYFNFIFCNGVLSHLESWQQTLNEFYRILKPKGKIWLNIFGDSRFRRLTSNLNKKLNKADKELIRKVLLLEGWNIQKVNYIESMFFWNKRILFKKKVIEKKFKHIGFKGIKFCYRGTDKDLNEKIYKNKSLKKLYNNGDLRYLLTK